MSDSRPDISAFVITKNNGDKIEECIKSLLWADEIIVVDDFSTDETPEICGRYPVKFVPHAFEGFQEQKKYATSIAVNDWVLKIDADERVTEQMKQSILELAAEDFERYSCFEFKRLTCFWGKWIRHASLYPDYNPRLFDKTRGEWGGINPHDKFITRGETRKLKGDILHLQNWDMNTYAVRTAAYSNTSAMEYYKLGKKVKLHHFAIRPLYTFLYRYFFRLGFVEGVRGFVISFMGAVGTFIKYSKLFELQHNMNRAPESGDDVTDN